MLGAGINEGGPGFALITYPQNQTTAVLQDAGEYWVQRLLLSA